MGRPASPPTTVLGVAVREKRGATPQIPMAESLGIPHSTLSRVERGSNEPSFDSARVLARWLGWTVEQVLDAARAPAPTDGD